MCALEYVVQVEQEKSFKTLGRRSHLHTIAGAGNLNGDNNSIAGLTLFTPAFFKAYPKAYFQFGNGSNQWHGKWMPRCDNGKTWLERE